MKAEPRPGVVNLKQSLPVELVDRPKVGDRWVSEMNELGFTIKAVTKKSVQVEVDRLVQKGTRQVVEVRSREVPIRGWDSFARPYRKLP